SAIDTIIKHTRLKDLIEFSRAVHAEMHSILIASRVAGEKIVGGKIFVTTYPCHACARHIIAAGIKEVYYIEPYRKSLATRLHSDAMTEAASSDEGSVRIIQYDGVAPRRFLDLFESESRKGKGGMLQLQEQEDALPSTNVSLRAIPRLEQVVVAEISSKSLQLPGLAS
ncbi:deaminase, partial [Lonsdalea populi]